MDHQVLRETLRTHTVCFDRQADPGIAAYVFYLDVLGQVPDHDLISFNPHPDAGHLRAAIAV
jgi:hypothetical protein